MTTLTAFARSEDVFSDVSQDAIHDLKWLLSVPQEPSMSSKDVDALYDEDTDSDEKENEGKIKVKAFREMVWRKWLKFCEATEKNPEEILIELSLDQDHAKRGCKAFLHDYVVNSVVWRPCLGPKEWEKVQTVTCAVTVADIWSALVHNANQKILRPKSKKEGKKPNAWVLDFSTKFGSKEGPAYDVARYIPKLANKLGLSLEQLVEKRQMTVEDVILFLDTLWTKAEHITCKPNVRNALHCVILLGAFGGWRPGSLMNIKYRDVQFGWFSHAKDPNKIWPVVTITIHHVKQKKNQIRRTQRAELKFTISTMACHQICLLSHLAATAIADNAFEANFTSPTQILDGQPLEPGINYVPLKWKSDMLDKHIVSISYSTYNKYWHRTLLVSGLRDAQRVVPYAMRVGAGIRLNETLSGPLRNFVLNHSSKIYESNYLPKHLSHDLAHASFGEIAGKQTDLSSSMSRVFTARDENAPIYITQEDQANFEKRIDITILRQARAKALEDEPTKLPAIYHRIDYILVRLTALRLEELRKEYFIYADKMRAEGKRIQHPDHSPTNYARSARGNSNWQTARRIGILLTQDNTKPDVIIQKLIGYLTNKLTKDVFPEAEDTDRAKRGYTCLLCSKRYTSKYNLNRHFHESHLEELKKGFPCPECLRGGKIDLVNAGPEAWSSHVARIHDKSNAPNLTWHLKLEDNTHMKEECTGKRKRPTSVESLHESSKKLRHHPDQKQMTVHKQQEEIACIKKEGEESFDFEYLLDTDGEERSNYDPHIKEEFYVSGRDDLDE